jgi:geranylgeranyl pyrophosphate synthase
LKQVPQAKADRERIREAARQMASGLDKSRPLARDEMEARARAILTRLSLPEGYVGWTMVALSTAFWRSSVVRVPYHRRLLLLPHCLRNAEACPAEYDELGLACQECGACSLAELRRLGRTKGYQVLIAEGSPIVLQIILAGLADAVLGVACLDSLEKALDKILLAGLPSMAVPLLTNTCRNTSTDEQCVREMIETPYEPGAQTTQTYLHLMRCAAGMFEPAELERLVPRSWGGPTLAQTDGQGLVALDPLAATEAVARDFLLGGGKHLRPFITLAAYDVMSGGGGSGADGAGVAARWPDAIKRVALAMEVFHKASLVHDDVEDDDPFRYGHPALHRKYGTPAAINIGDYLIGLGYRLVASEHPCLGAEVVADVLAQLGEAHVKLCEGQGAELAWRLRPTRRLAPLEALKIYALKTAPAFHAALYAGLRLAGPPRGLREPVARFARHLGVAFQILNDLADWDSHQPNKRTAATDALGGRPTVLWALALSCLVPADRRELESLVAHPPLDRDSTIRRVGQLYDRAGVYEKAAGLVAKHRRAARQVADAVQPDALRRLLHYFVDVIVPKTKYE